MASGELAAKHLIAQASKGFFGYGSSRAGIWVQGRLAVFASALTGPRLQVALADDAFGRLCMRHITGLYVRETRAAITQGAAAWGVRLRTVAGDLDLERRWALGVGIADGPLPGAAPEQAAPAALTALLAAGLGRPVRYARQGAQLVHAVADLPPALAAPPRGPGGGDARPPRGVERLPRAGGGHPHPAPGRDLDAADLGGRRGRGGRARACDGAGPLTGSARRE